MLFAWVPIALGTLDNSTPSNLMGAVSIGIVFGAAIAGFLIPLHKVNRALIGGLLLGPLVMLLALTQSLPVAVALLIALGAAGGMFVVPMNAMLQNAGHHTIGAGRALAVQNLWENMAMMLFAKIRYTAVRIRLPTMIKTTALPTLRFARAVSFRPSAMLTKAQQPSPIITAMASATTVSGKTTVLAALP